MTSTKYAVQADVNGWDNEWIVDEHGNDIEALFDEEEDALETMFSLEMTDRLMTGYSIDRRIELVVI